MLSCLRCNILVAVNTDIDVCKTIWGPSPPISENDEHIYSGGGKFDRSRNPCKSTSLKLICPVSFNISLRASISVNMRPIKSSIEADWS